MFPTNHSYQTRGAFIPHQPTLGSLRFSLFKIIYKRKKEHKLKGETLKICRAILADDKARIIPMVRWSFLRAGFRLNPKHFLVPLTITRTEILEQIVVPELYLEEFVFPAPNESVMAA
jgi:hypothetical protein